MSWVSEILNETLPNFCGHHSSHGSQQVDWKSKKCPKNSAPKPVQSKDLKHFWLNSPNNFGLNAPNNFQLSTAKYFSKLIENLRNKWKHPVVVWPPTWDISIKLCIKGDKFMEERLGNNVTSNTTQRSIAMLQPIWSYFDQWAVQTMFWSSIIAITRCFLQMSNIPLVVQIKMFYVSW